MPISKPDLTQDNNVSIDLDEDAEIDILNIDEPTDFNQNEIIYQSTIDKLISSEEATEGNVKLPKSAMVVLKKSDNLMSGMNLLPSLNTETIQSNQEYTCNNCEKKFLKKRQIIEHLKYCVLYSYNCPYCDFVVREYLEVMLQHMQKCHKSRKQYCKSSIESSTNSMKKSVANRIKPGFYQCPKCPSSFMNYKRRDYHIKKECCMKLICLWCKKSYTPSYNINEHIEDCDSKFQEDIKSILK